MIKTALGKEEERICFITGIVIIVIGRECTSFLFLLRLVGVVTLLKKYKSFGMDPAQKPYVRNVFPILSPM
jgi:hypothetical protein